MDDPQNPPAFDLKEEINTAFAVANAVKNIRSYFETRPHLRGITGVEAFTRLTSDKDLEQFVAKAIQITATKALTDTGNAQG
jgi:hypothetical protein